MEFVHINTIGFSALSRVPGISPELAKAILYKRKEYGDLIYEDVENIPEFVLTPELDQSLDFTASNTTGHVDEENARVRYKNPRSHPTRRSCKFSQERKKRDPWPPDWREINAQSDRGEAQSQASRGGSLENPYPEYPPQAEAHYYEDEQADYDPSYDSRNFCPVSSPASFTDP
jgi:hypothetical protein